MKLSKLLKNWTVPVFALVAAGMIVGCSNPASSSNGGGGPNSNTPGTDTPLFDASSVTVSANKIELSDGNWSYKEIDESDDGHKSITEKELTVHENGTVIVYTAIKSTDSGTIPEGTSTAQIEAAKAQGYIIDGNTYTSVYIYPAEEIEKENRDANYDFSSSDFKNIKTNSDKTKYSWIREETYTSYESKEDADNEVNGKKVTSIIECYLVKKTSASSGNEDKTETKEDNPISTGSTYKVIYDGITINNELSESEFNAIKTKSFPANPSNAYYSQSGKTVTLTDSGFSMLVATQSWMGIVVYNKEMIMPITADNMIKFGVFEEGTDYTKTHNNLVYELTAAGYQKGAEMKL